MRSAPSTPDLSAQHLRMLTEESSITPDVIAARAYRTVHSKAELSRLGFSSRQQRTPALLIPIYDATGEKVLYQARPDEPRIDPKSHRAIKYETPSGAHMRLDINPATRQHVGDPKVPLWLTEGVKKTDSIASRGRCAVGVIGVWNWRGRNDLGGKVALADWESVALNDRQVFIVFDSDVMLKAGVHLALSRLGAFLKSKGAKVRYVYLPTEDGSKAGVDDYLAAEHTIEDVEALSTPVLKPAPKSDEEEQVGQYRVEDGCLVRVKATRDGPVTEVLCNFDARIIAEDVLDDGAETTLHFTIAGKLATGQTLPEITIPAARFAGMSWTTDQWGLQAIVFAGIASRDHLRVAIQSQSKDAERRMTFGHTGWRQIGGVWAYLTTSGAITADGLDEAVRVDPGAGLSEYHLPYSPYSDVRRDALRASLALLRLGPAEIMAPLLASTYRAPFGNVDYSMNLHGGSGEGKTQFALLMVQHFGAGINEEQLLGWTSTANALEESLFRLKDTIAVIDDFAPTSDEYQSRRQRATVERTLRSAANSSARRRARPDGTVKPERPPRGLVLMTGEDSLPGYSVNARVYTIEVPRGTIRPLSLFTPHQEAGHAGKYALAMSAWVQHLAGGYPARKGEFERQWKAERETLTATHGRTVSTAAQLLTTSRMLLAFAEESGAITSIEATEYRDVFRAGILAAMAAQADHLAESNPIDEFLALLRSVVSTGRGHLEARDEEISAISSAPADHRLWGWTDQSTPQGRRIGWVGSPEVLLDPEATYAEVQRFARDQGTTLPLSKQTLWKRLAEHGVIARTDRQLKPKRMIRGERRRVLVFPGGISDVSRASRAGGTNTDQDDTEARPTSDEGVGQRPTSSNDIGQASAPSQTQKEGGALLALPAEGIPPQEIIDDLIQAAEAGKLDMVAGYKHNGTHTSALGPYLRRQADGGGLEVNAPEILRRNPDLAQRYGGGVS